MIDNQQWIETFKDLKIEKGMLVIIDGFLHDWDQTINQATTFLDALLSVVSSEGTVVCFSTNQFQIEPSQWDKDVDSKDYARIRKGISQSNNPLPSSDPLVNTMLLRDDVIKKRHPLYTVLAIGKYARFITRKIPLHFPNGKESPMQGCVDLKGYVLVLNELSVDSYPFSHCLSNENTPVYISGGLSVEHGVSFWQKFLHHKSDYQTLTQRFNTLIEKGKSKQKTLASNTLTLINSETIKEVTINEY